MRVLGRVIGVLLAVAAGVLLLVIFAEDIRGSISRGIGNAPQFAAADPVIVYPLDANHFTEFVLTRPQSSIRVLTHADLEPGVASLRYSFLVQGFDATGRLAFDREIYARTIVPYLRNSRGHLVPRAFYADSALIPSAVDATVLVIDGTVTRLRIRSGENDPGVRRVVARVQERRPMSVDQLETAWRRLSERDRAKLARGNALPSPFLTAEERNNLLQNRWFPVGTAGVRGTDYDSEILYERRDPTDTDALGLTRESELAE